MQKLAISLLFFTLCSTTVSIAQRRSSPPPLKDLPPLSGSFNNGFLRFRNDTVSGYGQLPAPDLGQLRRGLDSLRINFPNSQDARHYLYKDGKAYYMDIIPAPKGKRVDSSNVWLLRIK